MCGPATDGVRDYGEGSIGPCTSYFRFLRGLSEGYGGKEPYHAERKKCVQYLVDESKENQAVRNKLRWQHNIELIFSTRF